MGTIQSSVGLITGVPIQDTVDQLIAISSQPRDRLQSRTTLLQQEQIAVAELTALVVGLELSSASFGSEELFASTTASSSNSDALSVIRTEEDAVVADTQARVVQLAQTHSFSSAQFNSTTTSLGQAGTIRVATGGFVNTSANLSELNAGRGVERGSIQITDRSGTSAIVDLSQAVTVDDVLDSITEATGIRVSASTDGDSIVIHDLTGDTSSNLRISEVGGGSTAADLGLRNIDVASSTATGFDIDSLSGDTSLSSLLDGRGIDLGSGNNIDITLSDGTSFSVDFGDFSKDATKGSGVTNNASVDAQVTIETVADGGTYDGVDVIFIDDSSVTAGSESVELLEGSFGRQLVFRIDEGNTTSANIAAALASDSALSENFTATAGGTGAGVVSSADYTTISGGASIAAPDDPTLDDLLRVLNDQNPNFQASLATNGDGIELTDLSGGGGNFVIEDSAGSSAASDLGIASSVATSTISGGRLRSGLQSVSLNALAGGNGLGTLGSLSITTRDGSTASVDLSGAETVQDVLNTINESGLTLEAEYNAQGTGIAIRDLSGGTTSNLIVTSVDDTASLLGIEANVNDSLAVGEYLGAQTVSENTLLTQINQGNGVALGSFTITDSDGNSSALNLAVLESKTVGDVLEAINDLNIGVTASLNADGDGIQLVDTANGSGTLTVEDSGTGTAAADLGIAGTAESRAIDGEVVQALVGSETLSVNVVADDTIATIAEKINEVGRFATATVSNGRLEIRSVRGGEDGRLAINTSGLDLGFQEVSRGQDGLLEIGAPGSTVLHRSSDNVYSEAVTGLSFTAKEVTTGTVTASVNQDNSAVVSRVSTFVDQYNRLVDRVSELTTFDETSGATGLLFGSNEVLRIQNDLSRLISGRIGSAGSITSLSEIGVRLNDTGALAFDQSKLTSRLETDANAVKEFLTTEDTGAAARIKSAVDLLAGADNSLLLRRNEALTSKIDSNTERITSLTSSLGREETRLLTQFYAMEQAIASLQANQSALTGAFPTISN